MKKIIEDTIDTYIQYIRSEPVTNKEVEFLLEDLKDQLVLMYEETQKEKPKIRDLLLKLFKTEDQWVQNIPSMVNKNDPEEMLDWTHPYDPLSIVVGYDFEDKPIYNTPKRVPREELSGYIPLKSNPNCWCLSAALMKLKKQGHKGTYDFRKLFEEQYGDIVKFNDSHNYNEVIKAIKSIDA
jgi:hypothetical protein